MLLHPSPIQIWHDHAADQSESLLCDDGPEVHKSIAVYVNPVQIYHHFIRIKHANMQYSQVVSYM